MDETVVSVLTLLIIAVIAVMTIHALRTSDLRTVQNAPGLLTSLGIFGTFLGITIGLASFDPARVAESVPRLFGGIQLAFWTSVAGILGSVLVKLRLLMRPPGGIDAAPATINDLVVALKDLRLQSGRDAKTLHEGMERMAEATQAAARQSDDALGRLAAQTPDAAIERLAERMGRDSERLGERLGEALASGNQSIAEALAGNRDAMAAQITTAVTELRDALVGPDGAAGDLARRLQEHQASLSAAVSGATRDLQRAIGSDVDRLAEKLADDGEVTRAIETLNERAAKDSASLAKQLEAMGAESGKLGEQLGKDVSRALGESAQLNRDAVAATVAAAVTELRDALVGPDGAATALAAEIRGGQEQLAEALGGAVNGLREAIGEGGGAQSAQLDALADSIQTLGESLASGYGAGLDSVSGEIGTMSSGIADAIDDLRLALVGPDGAAADLASRLEQGQGELARSLGEAAESMRLAAGASSAAVAEQFKAMADSLSDEVKTAVAKQAEALKAGAGQQASDVRELSAALTAGLNAAAARQAAALAEAAEGQDATLKGLGAQLGKLSETVRDELQAAGKDAGKAIGAELAVGIQAAAAKQAAALAAAAAGHEAQLKALASGLGEQIGSLSSDLQSDRKAGKAAKVSAADADAAVKAMSAELGRGLNAMSVGMAGAIQELREALAGPDGSVSAVVREIHESRQATGEALEGIAASLKHISDNQIDYSPKQLLQVLEEMIRQFNTQFSGQFWEKFGGFNQGIGELIEWMNTYRKQLTDMSDHQAQMSRAMDTATRRFDEVSSNSAIFVDVARNLSGMLSGIDDQRVQIEAHIKQFARLTEATRDSLEDIEQRIVDGNEGMNGHLREVSDRIEDQVNRLDSALEKELSKAMVIFGQQLAALSEKFVEDYGPLTERLRAVVRMADGV